MLRRKKSDAHRPRKTTKTASDAFRGVIAFLEGEHRGDGGTGGEYPGMGASALIEELRKYPDLRVMFRDSDCDACGFVSEVTLQRRASSEDGELQEPELDPASPRNVIVLWLRS